MKKYWKENSLVISKITNLLSKSGRSQREWMSKLVLLQKLFFRSESAPTRSTISTVIDSLYVIHIVVLMNKHSFSITNVINVEVDELIMRRTRLFSVC